jgi:hypothetical protein
MTTIAHADTCGVATKTWHDCTCGVALMTDGRNHADGCPCRCTCDFGKRLKAFVLPFECGRCGRAFPTQLEMNVHCCQGDPAAHLIRVYHSPPRLSWWRRLWAWLQIDSYE